MGDVLSSYTYMNICTSSVPFTVANRFFPLELNIDDILLTHDVDGAELNTPGGV